MTQNSDNLHSIPAYESLPDGRLTDDMVAAFKAAGVIIVEDFVSLRDCNRLRERAHELVEAFDPDTVRSIFSTTKQSQLNDEYFYDSGDKIRFFFEDDAL